MTSQLIVNGEGIGETDSVRALFAKILANEFSRPNQRNADFENNSVDPRFTSPALLVVASSLLTFVFFSFRGETAVRKRAKGDPQDSRKLFDMLVENLPVAVLTKYAKDLRLLRMNMAGEETLDFCRADNICVAGFGGYSKRLSPAWERTLGYTLGELMRKPLVEFAHPNNRQAALEKKETFVSVTNLPQFESRFMRKEGAYRRSHSGTGRFLSMIRYLSEDIGGKENGHGAIFDLSLPSFRKQEIIWTI